MSINFNNLLFDEGFYLDSYPEVLSGVQDGIYESGLDHWEKYGKDHCYAPNKHFNESNYLLNNPHIAYEIEKEEYDCALHHWLKYNDLLSTLEEYSNEGNALNKGEIKYLEVSLLEHDNHKLYQIAEILVDQISKYKAKLSNDGLTEISEIIWECLL